jgi:hypothetical protein
MCCMGKREGTSTRDGDTEPLTTRWTGRSVLSRVVQGTHGPGQSGPQVSAIVRTLGEVRRVTARVRTGRCGRHRSGALRRVRAHEARGAGQAVTGGTIEGHDDERSRAGTRAPRSSLSGFLSRW